MIGRMLYGAAAAALVTATAVLGQPAASGSNAGADKQICRASTDTGSRLGRSRSCHTAREWAELRRETQQNIDHVQNARAASGQ
jgi:hypothetical protein